MDIIEKLGVTFCFIQRVRFEKEEMDREDQGHIPQLLDSENTIIIAREEILHLRQLLNGK